jgi:hypothetical protein
VAERFERAGRGAGDGVVAGRSKRFKVWSSPLPRTLSGPESTKLNGIV